MAKTKKIAALLGALLVCSSIFATVACGKGNTGDNGSSSSSSEYVPPAPSVFKLEEHTWTGWETVTEKTCTRDGQEKLVCTDEGCGEVKTRTVKAGHVWGDWTGNMDNLCMQDAQLSRVVRTAEKRKRKRFQHADTPIKTEYARSAKVRSRSPL